MFVRPAFRHLRRFVKAGSDFDATFVTDVVPLQQLEALQFCAMPFRDHPRSATLRGINAARPRMICSSGRDMPAIRPAVLSSSWAMERRVILRMPFIYGPRFTASIWPALVRIRNSALSAFLGCGVVFRKLRASKRFIVSGPQFFTLSQYTGTFEPYALNCRSASRSRLFNGSVGISAVQRAFGFSNEPGEVFTVHCVRVKA